LTKPWQKNEEAAKAACQNLVGKIDSAKPVIIDWYHGFFLHADNPTILSVSNIFTCRML
jgi:hypothetical protein